MHVGSAACDEKAVAKTVKGIQDDPLSFWVGLGDMAECINRQDIRFRQSNLASWLRSPDDPEDKDFDWDDDVVQPQIDRVVELLSPIADKSLGGTFGNHEDKQLTVHERNVHRSICKRLQIDNLSDEALISVRFIRGKSRGGKGVKGLDIYVHHGWFAPRGASASSLMSLLARWDVDIAGVGHGHTRQIAPVVVTGGLDRKGNYVTRRRYALMTGSFRKAHQVGTTCYESRKGYPLSDIGPIRMWYKPDTGELRAEL